MHVAGTRNKGALCPCKAMSPLSYCQELSRVLGTGTHKPQPLQNITNIEPTTMNQTKLYVVLWFLHNFASTLPLTMLTHHIHFFYSFRPADYQLSFTFYPAKARAITGFSPTHFILWFSFLFGSTVIISFKPFFLVILTFNTFIQSIFGR